MLQQQRATAERILLTNQQRLIDFFFFKNTIFGDKRSLLKIEI